MVCVAVSCTVSVWVLRSDGVATLSEFRGLYVPTVPMLFVGLLAPFNCLAMVIAMLVLIVRFGPRPFTAIIFFNCVILVIVVDSWFWDCSLRMLIAMTFSSLLLIGETILRKLPTPITVASVLSLFVTFGYYSFLGLAEVIASI